MAPSDVVSATVCWCTGHATGVSAGEQLGMSLLLLPLLVTIVITIVADLDRPRHGLITISQESMRQVQALLEGNQFVGLAAKAGFLRESIVQAG